MYSNKSFDNLETLEILGVSLTSWGEGASLALVGHHSSDDVTMKIDDFGVSDAIDEISVWGCKLDFGAP